MKNYRIINSLLISIIFISGFGVLPVKATRNSNRICNGPAEPITILVIGADTRTPGYLFGLADTIMVFRVDFQNQDVRALGFPRDLWVVIPDVEEDNGRTHGKLNQAYFYGTEGMGYYSGSDFGAGLLKATFQYNWNFNIDRYVVINLRTFRDVVDAVGGIEIYNPSPVYSFHQSDQPVLRAGSYFFTGSDALNYARYRDPKNVYDRVDRQAIVLNALYEAVFSPSTIPKIPKLVGLYKGNVLTDLHLAEVSQFLCLAAKINLEEVRFSRIPKEALYFPDWEGFVWLEKKPGTIETILNQFQEGAYPE